MIKSLLHRLQSTCQASELTTFPHISLKLNESIWIRGRVHKTRVKGNIGFLILRHQLSTVQCCLFKSDTIPKSSLKFIESLPNESIIDIYGKVMKSEKPTSCSISDYEIQVQKYSLVSRSQEMLPFSYEEGQIADRVQLKTRLDSRVMDLRLPVNFTIFQLTSLLCAHFRNSLLDRNFIEIHSPKIIEGVSEGGSEVFTTEYFGRKACLAQSPQLYKQMAILGDLDKVFEVGPVFRAENSNTHRHLCEFTGLDVEMTLVHDYLEVVRLVYGIFVNIFTAFDEKKDFEVVYKYFGTEKIRFKEDLLMFTFEEACSMLKEEGFFQEVLQDISQENEKALGKIVKKKFDTDFYVVHRYPTIVRPFYTKPCEDNLDFSCSFDVFLRGEEIASGSQRIHDYEELKKSALQRSVNIDGIQSYLDCFKYGAYPHGGCGLGLERVIMLYLGVPNIRYTSLFPRDPKRLNP